MSTARAIRKPERTQLDLYGFISVCGCICFGVVVDQAVRPYFCFVVVVDEIVAMGLYYHT